MPRSLVPEGVLALSADPTGVRAGQTYWNTSTATLRTYNGTTWVNAVPTPTATSQAFDPGAPTRPPSAYPTGLSYGSVVVGDGWPSNGTITTSKRFTTRVSQLFVSTNQNLAETPTFLVRYGYQTPDSAVDGWGPWSTFGSPDSTFNTIQLNSTVEATATSTGHALKIGPASSQNMAVDTNTIQVRVNGNPNTQLHLQEFAGLIGVNRARPDSDSMDLFQGTIRAYRRDSTGTQTGWGQLLLQPDGGLGTVGTVRIGQRHTFSNDGFTTDRHYATNAAPTVASELTRKDYVDSAIGNKTSFDGIDLASATEVTLTSTAHPLRIGPAATKNLAVDRDTIQGRNNGTTGDIELQPLGGRVTFGNRLFIDGATIDSGPVALELNVYNSLPTYIGEAVVISAKGDVATRSATAGFAPTQAAHLTRKDYVDTARSDSDIMNIMGAF